MDVVALRNMVEAEESHWWWAARRSILRQVVRDVQRSTGTEGMLFDLGCGAGSNLRVLEEFGKAIGVDSSEDTVAYARSRGRGNVLYEDLSRETALASFPPQSASVVLLADVLEHLDDEQSALRKAHRLLSPKGALVVTVPAFEWLWGPADELNHHRRRYTRRSLRAVLDPLFAVERLTYFNFWLLPAIAAGRFISRALSRPAHEEIREPAKPINALLRAVFSSESGLLRHVDLPIGVSLLAVARKRE